MLLGLSPVLSRNVLRTAAQALVAVGWRAVMCTMCYDGILSLLEAIAQSVVTAVSPGAQLNVQLETWGTTA